MDPSVHMVASVIPASVIILVKPNSSAVRIFGANMIILTGPIAKPNMITIVD